MARSGVALAHLLVIALGMTHSSEARSHYLGKEVGPLSQLQHGVRGRVYVVDARTLYVHDLHYDGVGPAAYFYVGWSSAPGDAAGSRARLRDERGGGRALRRYGGEGVTLALPDGKTVSDIKWFSIWCDDYAVNFGSVLIPLNVDPPRPAKVGALRGVHGVRSDPVVVVDAQTLLVPNFSYDGEAPDAKFWVGRGDKPSPQGIRIPDENGKEAPLRKYDRKTIVLTLPGELTVFDIGHFGVWCEAFTVNFGHVALPAAAALNVPPSLSMLGVSPQSRNRALSAGGGGGGGGSQRPLPRPIAKVDATTYRPALRAGPSLPADNSDHAAHLHRRADDYKHANQQLIAPQPTTDYDKPDDRNRQNEQYQQQIYQQQQIDYHQQDQQYVQPQQQNYQLENQYQQLDSQQLYLYQQQLYEQQRRLQQLLEEQYRLNQAQGPVQYRLLPYQNEHFGLGEGAQDRSYREGGGEVTIQRSIDLDLVSGTQ